MPHQGSSRETQGGIQEGSASHSERLHRPPWWAEASDRVKLRRGDVVTGEYVAQGDGSHELLRTTVAKPGSATTAAILNMAMTNIVLVVDSETIILLTGYMNMKVAAQSLSEYH